MTEIIITESSTTVGGPGRSTSSSRGQQQQEEVWRSLNSSLTFNTLSLGRSSQAGCSRGGWERGAGWGRGRRGCGWGRGAGQSRGWEEEVMTTTLLQMILNMFHNVEFIFINIYNFTFTVIARVCNG